MEHVENILIIIIMAAACFNSSEKRLPITIIIACMASIALYELPVDIAVYYAVSGLLCSVVAFISFSMNLKAAKVYAVVIAIQGVICYSLINDLTYDYNEIVQIALDIYGNTTAILTVILGVLGSDNILTCMLHRWYIDNI